MGNSVYFQDLGNNIYVLDLADGSLKWSHVDNIQNLGPNGPAVGWGKVFGSSGPYTMAAWDVETGEMLCIRS
jgi:outer membrane protein assembly factor BamB